MSGRTRTDATMTDEDIVELFDRCSNEGKWGADDERGTLNHITAEKRLHSAAEVRIGRCLSLSWPVRPGVGVMGSVPVVHRMLLRDPVATGAVDYVGIAAHDPGITHVDALCHVYWEGRAYNGRTIEEVLTGDGLRFGSVHAQRDGVFTRGVCLDVAAVRGVSWLEAGDFVGPDDLEAAEARQGIRVESGDALFVYVGREARTHNDPSAPPLVRAGLHASAVPWLHERRVSVYSGDCTERLPYPSVRFPFPLHQIGLASMGLCMLDAPQLAPLHEICEELGRWSFLLVFAPLDVTGATGSAVNPLAVF